MKLVRDCCSQSASPNTLLRQMADAGIELVDALLPGGRGECEAGVKPEIATPKTGSAAAATAAPATTTAAVAATSKSSPEPRHQIDYECIPEQLALEDFFSQDGPDLEWELARAQQHHLFGEHLQELFAEVDEGWKLLGTVVKKDVACLCFCICHPLPSHHHPITPLGPCQFQVW